MTYLPRRSPLDSYKFIFAGYTSLKHNILPEIRKVYWKEMYGCNKSYWSTEILLGRKKNKKSNKNQTWIGLIFERLVWHSTDVDIGTIKINKEVGEDRNMSKIYNQYVIVKQRRLYPLGRRSCSIFCVFQRNIKFTYVIRRIGNITLI